ncbi:MAG: hypothetical protein LW698_03105 [Planctomycetaceae bacterium]|jgi:hypothetical protein|nr:hypothetical protein [Planctomycetaceae bacterium]
MRSIVIAAALLAAWAAPVSRAAEPVRLRYRFQVGDRIDMDVAHRAVTETTMNGSTQTVETMTDSRKTWRVVAVDAAGRATLEHSVDDVVMTSRTSDKGEVRWASAGTDDPPPGYEGVRQSLGVTLSRMVIDPSGRILDRRELRPCHPSATGDLVVVPLPDEPVMAGVEWTIPQEVVVEAPGAGRKAVRTRLRYRLEDVHDGVATIRVDTTVLTPVDDPRLEARLLERIWDGTIKFDIEAGRVTSRKTGIDRRVVGFGGPQSSVRYKSTLEERVR